MNALRRGRLLAGVLSGVAAVFVCAASLRGAEDARTAAGTGKAAPGKRDARQIAEEIQTAGEELAPLFGSTQELFDAKRRQEAAPKAVPVLRKMVGLLDELQSTRPIGSIEGPERAQLLALMAAMGDKDAAATLTRMAGSPNLPEAAAGRSAQVVARWMQSGADAAAQQKVVDEFSALVKQYPTQDAVAAAAMMLAGTTQPEAGELRQRIRTTVATTLKTPRAAAVVQQLEATEAKLGAVAVLKALEGKPIVVEGLAVGGRKISTADWKGKVVLVDFWATWCKPCKEELPQLKQAYEKYHARGLEVLGVSCDNNAEEVQKFVAQNKDVPWPHLFDASKPGWHAVAQQYHINAIPRMFLIDRKGVLRSVEARGNYDKLIPALLDEKAQ